MRFEVRAIDAQQHLKSIAIEALDIGDVHVQLRERQLTPLKVSSSSSGGFSFQLGQRKNTFDLLLFAQELQTLVAAGLSIVETLEALIERASRDNTKLILQRLVNHLRDGQRLSGALSLQSETFPALFIGIVQAAEDTSDLPKALQRYVVYETQLQSLRHKITSAAIYPAILLGVGSMVGLFLLGYVVPRFASVYQGSGRPLPIASQWLLLWGQWVSENRGVVFFTLLTLIAVAGWSVSQVIRRYGWMRLLQWLPGAKPRLRVLELSRLYLSMGMLIEGGISITRAMELASAVLPQGSQTDIFAAQSEVTQGNNLSSSLENHGLATPVALRLIRVGEQTGQLGTMLSRAAAFYDNETQRWIERFTKAFEPILMAAIGIVIGLIVILLYMPIFDLAGSLQ